MTTAATAPQQEQAYDGFIGTRRNAATNNPHLPHFAYMPGVYFAQANPRTTGYRYFPQGTLITFETFESGGHQNPDFYENSKASPGMVREISARLALLNAATEFHTVEGVESGFTSLPMLTGNPQARALFDAIHPPFAAINAECPFGLTACPTCRSLWFESEASKTYFTENIDEDVDRDLALEVKTSLYNANQSYAAYCVQMWGELADANERTRGKENPFVLRPEHHHYRKCAHAMSFEDREMQRMQNMTAANAESIGNAVRSGSHGLTDAELAAFYTWKASQKPVVVVTAPKPTEKVVVETEFTQGANVLCEGEKGFIEEVKTAGWFVVRLASGETKTVRKDKLEAINESET